jgi:hypothetical protein
MSSAKLLHKARAHSAGNPKHVELLKPSIAASGIA